MSLFQSLLEELSKKIKGTELHKNSISKDISEVLSIVILPDQLKIKNGEIFINVSPTIKTVIKLKKGALLTVVGKYGIKDIK